MHTYAKFIRLQISGWRTLRRWYFNEQENQEFTAENRPPFTLPPVYRTRPTFLRRGHKALCILALPHPQEALVSVQGLHACTMCSSHVVLLKLLRMPLYCSPPSAVPLPREESACCVPGTLQLLRKQLCSAPLRNTPWLSLGLSQEHLPPGALYTFHLSYNSVF